MELVIIIFFVFMVGMIAMKVILPRRAGKKSADRLCAHFLVLGMRASILEKHPLQKVGGGNSLGLVQVAERNIGYVNVLKYIDEGTAYYYLDYLVPLKDIPSGLCWAELHTKKRGLLRREVVDIEWRGGTLADTLNGDLTLKQNLLIELRRNGPLDIQIAPEPVYRCVRIETESVRIEAELCISAGMFDCLDRIAGLIQKHVAEVNSRPEEVLIEAKAEINPRSKDAEIVDCFVTDRRVLLKLREPLEIPLYMVENCYVSTSLPSFGTGMAEVIRSTVTLTYRHESGHRQKTEFEMSTYNAGGGGWCPLLT